MKAREILSELGNKPHRMSKKWDAGPSGATKSIILPDGRTLVISIDSAYEVSDESLALVNFYVDGEQTVTGKGDAFRIFSTVASAIRDYAKKYNPVFIVFTSSMMDDSRIKLYNSMVNVIVRYFPDYSNITNEPDYYDHLYDILDDLQDIQGQKLYVLVRELDDEEYDR